jgi:hypothetical protein
MICYWSERCMLRPSLWFFTGHSTVCYDQVYDLLPVRTPYITISNSYIYIDCCVQIVFYQVYDLLLVRTLYGMTKLMICYWSECHMLRLVIVSYKLTAVFILYSTKFKICYWSEHCMVWSSLWFVTGQNTVCYDQVYDLLLFRTPYATISNSYIIIDCCIHIVFYQVYDLLLVKMLYVTTKVMICYWSERHMLR